MDIIQVCAKMSNEMRKKVDSGEYNVSAVVLRDSKGGKITAHLPIEKGFSFLNESKIFNLKTGLLIASSGFAVGAITTFAFDKYKKYKDKNKIETNYDKQFHSEEYSTSITSYLNAINTKTLNLDIINDAKNILIFIKKVSENNNTNIKIDVDKTNELFDFIYKYTLDLAKINNIDFKFQNENKSDNLLNIINCLDYQSKIFELGLDKKENNENLLNEPEFEIVK